MDSKLEKWLETNPVESVVFLENGKHIFIRGNWLYCRNVYQEDNDGIIKPELKWQAGKTNTLVILAIGKDVGKPLDSEKIMYYKNNFKFNGSNIRWKITDDFKVGDIVIVTDEPIWGVYTSPCHNHDRIIDCHVPEAILED